MSLKRIYKKDVVTVEENVTAAQAARMMQERHVGCLIVTGKSGKKKNKYPLGIITDRDLMLECVAKGADPNKRYVSQIMKSKPVTIYEDQGPAEAIRLMEEHGINRLPVVDDDGELEGVLAKEDLFRLLADEASVLSKVGMRQRSIEAGALSCVGPL